MRGRKWTEDEDSLLRQLVEQHGKQWSLIASKMENRTAGQVSSRWEKCINPNLTKGPFSQEEDQIVIDYVEKHGPANWPRLAEILKVRSPKQCRERWFNHLDPNLSKESWTLEEDQIILEQHTKIGPKWSLIAKYLPRRSDNAIKNRWNSSISKRLQKGPDGNPVLIEETMKKAQKAEKKKARPILPPIPIQKPQPSRWNVEFTTKKGISFVPTQWALPVAQGGVQIHPQGIQQPIQGIPQIFNSAQLNQIPIQMQQQPQVQQQIGTSLIAQQHPIIIHSPTAAIVGQAIPQAQNPQNPQQPATITEYPGAAALQPTPQSQQNLPKGTTGEPQLFAFAPFDGSSTPLQFECFSPVSPNPLFFQASGMVSPLNRHSDRNVFK